MSFAGDALSATSPGIHVGGAELIVTFFEDALRIGVDHVRVLAPYVDDGAFADDAFRSAWERLLPRAETVVVVRTVAAAETVLGAVRRTHRLDVRLDPRLHAKVFVGWRFGGEIALAGSHNLTGAALHANKEVGILIKPGVAAELRPLVRRLRDAADDAVRASTPYRTCAKGIRP